MSKHLTQVHDAIISQLKNQFGHKVKSIRVHSPLIKQFEAPALLLTLDTMSQSDETGDGRTATQCSFSVCAVLPVHGLPLDRVAIAAANYAAELLDFIKYNHWGLGVDVGHPQQLSAQPADFKPGKTGYESWVVNWQQTVYLGDTEADDGIIPTTVMVGMEPDIGADNEHKYEKL